MAGTGIVARQRLGLPARREAPPVERAVARALGWFSLALGALELLLPGRLARGAGLGDRPGLARVYGLREVGTGAGLLLSRDPTPWVWGRVAGDALDLATVAAGLGGRRPDRAALTLAVLLPVVALDVWCARRLSRSG